VRATSEVKLKVHHRNRKDQAERSEDISEDSYQQNPLLRKAVNYDPELKTSYKGT